MTIDLSDVLLGVCAVSAIVAAFLWSVIAGLILVAVAAGFLALAFRDVTVELPKVRPPWRS